MAETKKKTAKKAEAKNKEAEIKEVQLIVEAAPVVEDSKAAVAKAGKKSAKAVRETEEKEVKEARKASVSEPKQPSKTAKNPTRPKVERSGKKYREASKLIEKDKQYTLAEALELTTKTSTTKFDATVEM